MTDYHHHPAESVDLIERCIDKLYAALDDLDRRNLDASTSSAERRHYLEQRAQITRQIADLERNQRGLQTWELAA